MFESLFETLKKLKADGYTIDLPESVEDLKFKVTEGNASEFGTLANVHDCIPTEDHVRNQPHLDEIESQWGPAPGKENTDGSGLFILGHQFGNVLVMVQPGFGYEGDPMRLLFEKGFAPTHAFAAAYRYLKDIFKADAVLHFGTHGALEFMPGKQCGMSETCWPDRLIGDIPNFYFYAANNPSEATIAKRRSAATMISYLTPSVTQAGLYRGLSELKASLDRLRNLQPENEAEYRDVLDLVKIQAEQLDLLDEVEAHSDEAMLNGIRTSILEMEYALIPNGLHVAGQPMKEEDRKEMLTLIADAGEDGTIDKSVIESIARNENPVDAADCKNELIDKLLDANRHLSNNRELDGIVAALDGHYIEPAPSGDLLRSPDLLPTGRNIHGFDPFRIPSQFAVTNLVLLT